MKNHLNEYFEGLDNHIFEFYETINQNISSKKITIQMTFLYNKHINFHYNIENDELVIEDFVDKIKLKYPNFSKLQDEAYHFQKMTVWPHISFECTEVEKFMIEIERIKNETEFAPRAKS
ncbi:hypothetical protein [Yersinia phage fHe-Yen9-04]|uniref:Uncharacterized protein n=1 Tax=Yersinia phage fHe-Yen9-04 TaxID=2052742 RepID=A0A2C9CXU1_9CAUD|nr:hypothetical protein FDJ41_gp517 [Yersinia phage fHe-Yen9-04]SOK58663.1 hypothetical protein [Yersinia phage fHe-Yen9-04]VUE36432.1 hypothetical protein [Yersinia phage fHe-Yen9-04]